MLHSTSTLIAAFAALPAILGQASNTNATRSPAAPSSANTTSQPTDTTGTSTSTFTPTNFTPVTATGSSCGTAQQNFNQCVTKVGKDISNCGDNVCLCQTYANIAACYNGCAELAAQGQQYQSQSAQYCTVAGVKPNSTATVTPNVTAPTTTTTTTPSNTSPIQNTSNTTNANTFSAAKGSGSSMLGVSAAGAVGALSASLVAMCL